MNEKEWKKLLEGSGAGDMIELVVGPPSDDCPLCVAARCQGAADQTESFRAPGLQGLIRTWKKHFNA
jgi:hypothetical protein